MKLTKLVDTVIERWRAPSDYDSITGRKNALHLIQLRWIAVVGQISTIAMVNLVLHIVIPTPAMLAILIFLIAFNIASALRWQESVHVSSRELFVALLVDVITLTAQLYLSGGIQNPFVFLYLLQVIISAVLLDVTSTWCIVVITSACLAGLSVFSVPLQLPPAASGLSALYTQGTVICFLLNAALLTIFITRINRNRRADEAQLAEMRQRAAEEDHIVRMGLLASGAAHELGTPLATLSVILGDWQRMPEFSANAEVRQEMHDMQIQLKRCKSIISGILLSAGEVRSEASARTSINRFLNELVDEWKTCRAVNNFEYANQITEDFPIAFNTALKQMICNVLDNAAEASPDWVRFEAHCDAGALKLLVCDAGPGFSAEMLAQFGKPYQSSKGRPGRGLGLFFVVNVARKLGGTVSAYNQHQANAAAATGAVVRFSLPLNAIRLEPTSESEPDV
jgi:two-component system sensor histidine kinase RegB